MWTQTQGGTQPRGRPDSCWGPSENIQRTPSAPGDTVDIEPGAGRADKLPNGPPILPNQQHQTETRLELASQVSVKPPKAQKLEKMGWLICRCHSSFPVPNFLRLRTPSPSIRARLSPCAGRRRCDRRGRRAWRCRPRPARRPGVGLTRRGGFLYCALGVCPLEKDPICAYFRDELMLF